MLSLGLGLWSTTAVQGGGAPWTPASLPGIRDWAEADPTKLYTDSGVTLVSADGQSVQQINNKATGANWRQTTVGQQFVYKTGAGKPYLQATAASSQFMQQITTAVPGDGSGQHYVAVAAYFNRTSAREYVTELADGSTGSSNIENNFGTPLAGINNTVPATFTDTTGAITAATPYVLIAAITSTSIEIFQDNVSNGSTAVTGTISNNASNLFLGANAGVASFLDGRIYGVVHGTGLLSSGDRASLQTYMAALHP